MRPIIHSTRIATLKNLLKSLILILGIGTFMGCSGPDSSFTQTDRKPVIFPEYTDIAIPPNMAPLNFYIKEEGSEFKIRLSSVNGAQINITSTDGVIQFPERKWKNLLRKIKRTGFTSGRFLRRKTANGPNFSR